MSLVNERVKVSRCVGLLEQCDFWSPYLLLDFQNLCLRVMMGLFHSDLPLSVKNGMLSYNNQNMFNCTHLQMKSLNYERRFTCTQLRSIRDVIFHWQSIASQSSILHGHNRSMFPLVLENQISLT